MNEEFHSSFMNCKYSLFIMFCISNVTVNKHIYYASGLNCCDPTSVSTTVMRVAWGKIDSVLKEHRHGHFAPYQLLRKSQVYLRGGGGGGGGSSI